MGDQASFPTRRAPVRRSVPIGQRPPAVDAAGEVGVGGVLGRVDDCVGDARLVDAGRGSGGGSGGCVVGAQAVDVDGDAGGDVLDVGFGQAAVAGVAQVRAADGLGDGA